MDTLIKIIHVYTYEFKGIIKKKCWAKILKFVKGTVICYWFNTALTSQFECQQ
jgi:hypothetical protein